jgi:GNAT superfamily N-acetyltransferase
VFDTAKGEFLRGRGLWRRPRIELEILETNWSAWPLFEPHHYLKLPRMPCSTCYVGLVEGEPVAHLAVSSKTAGRYQGVTRVEARACRLVVMPEWQGAGVGMRFLNHIAQRYLDGEGRLWIGRRLNTLFHTSHPGLAAALRRDPKWRQVSAVLHGSNKAASARSINRSTRAKVKSRGEQAGYGGHFRAVQGFRYVGERRAEC